MSVIELRDDSLILPVLEQDRSWAAFALCDLDEPYCRYARFVGTLKHGQCEAVLLIYTPPGFNVLIPCGSPDLVGLLVEQGPDLPDSTLIMARPSDRSGIELGCLFDEPGWMLRMVVTPDALVAPTEQYDAVRLGLGDEEAIRDLYALWSATAFRREMLDVGTMYGIYDEGRLVAVAGTHAISTRHRVGAIGGVFTHPRYRSRGLATAVTGAVANALRADGIHDIALNVHADNDPAITAYRRLGFKTHAAFLEGQAVRRP
jgi:ribosomal protein S18 acetylase RimI-like enzyme